MNNRLPTQNRSKYAIGGVLHIGSKHPEKGYPVANDFFTARPKGGGNELNVECKLFHKVFGAQPKELYVMFTSKDAVSQSMELWKGKECAARSDMYSVTFQNEAQKTYETVSFDNIEECGEFCENFATQLNAGLPENKKLRWRKKTKLVFWLPKLQIMCLWELDTNSETWSDAIVNVFDDAVESGYLLQTPFILSVEMAQSQAFGQVHKYPRIKLQPAVNRITLELLANQEMGMLKILNAAAPSQFALPTTQPQQTAIGAGTEPAPQPAPVQEPKPKKEKAPIEDRRAKAEALCTEKGISTEIILGQFGCTIAEMTHDEIDNLVRFVNPSKAKEQKPAPATTPA